MPIRRQTSQSNRRLRAAPQNNLARQMALERDSFVASLYDAECGEGIDAFLENRDANFRS